MSRRAGLSLIEVIISIAILVAATAILGQLVFIGEKQASKAELLTQAQALCHNKMNEIMGGLIPLEPTENEAVGVDSPWDVTIQVAAVTGDQQITYTGLVAVTVIVKEHTEQLETQDANGNAPLEFRLVRWLYQDAGNVDAATDEEEANEEQADNQSDANAANSSSDVESSDPTEATR